MSRPFHILAFLICAAAVQAASVRVEPCGPDRLILFDGTNTVSRVVLSSRASALEQLAAQRIARTAREVFGFDLPVLVDDGGSLKGAIVIGTMDGSETLREAASEADSLGPDGFVIRRAAHARGEFLAVAAKGAGGVFHGAGYVADFAMQSAGGVVALQAGAVRRDSPIRLRGTYNLVCWGLTPRYTRQDWEKVIDAMAEDGMNFIYFWLSGVFRSKQFPESFIYPETPLTHDDVRSLIRYAHGRGVDFYLGTGVFAWFGIDEIAKYRSNFREVGIPYMSRTNAAARQGMKNYLHELVDEFPEAKGMWLEIADEGDYACKDPFCQQTIDEYGSKQAGQVTPTFLKEFSAELWKKQPHMKLVWGIGYPEAHKWDVKYYEELRKSFRDPRYHFMEVRQNWELQDREGVLKPLKQLSDNALHWDQYYRLSMREIGEHARRIHEDGLAGYAVAFEPGFNSHSVFGRSIPFPVDAVPYRFTRFAYREFTQDPALNWPAFKKRLLDHFFGEGADPELFDLAYTLFEFMRTGPITGSFRELTKPVDGSGYGRMLKPRLAAIERRLSSLEPGLGPRAKNLGIPLLRRAIADLRTGYSIQ